MIEEIKIDGKVYELFHDSTNDIMCNKCDLLGFCQKEERFIDLCENNNNNGYYKRR